MLCNSLTGCRDPLRRQCGGDLRHAVHLRRLPCAFGGADRKAKHAPDHLAKHIAVRESFAESELLAQHEHKSERVAFGQPEHKSNRVAFGGPNDANPLADVRPWRRQGERQPGILFRGVPVQRQGGRLRSGRRESRRGVRPSTFSRSIFTDWSSEC